MTKEFGESKNSNSDAEASIESTTQITNSSISSNNSFTAEANAEASIESSESVDLGNNVSVYELSKAEVTASASFESEANLNASVDEDGVEFKAEIGQVAEASATATASSEVGLETGLGKIEIGGEIESEVSVKEWATAEVGGEAGKEGVSANFDASVGYAAEAEVGGEAHVGAIKTDTSVGVSAGAQAGISGDAHATFKEGVVDVGIEGEAAALVGIKGDVDIKIDTKEITDEVKEASHVITHPVETTQNVKKNVARESRHILNKMKKQNRKFKKIFKFA
tara:strand:+ start:1052 stop:1894 length:843 start_codon:yes stop_codon:yes gene_type:complete